MSKDVTDSGSIMVQAVIKRESIITSYNIRPFIVTIRLEAIINERTDEYT